MKKSSIAGKHILIVEDDRMLAEHLQAYLQDAGCYVTCAWSKDSGLKAAQKEGVTLDLALIDFYLPVKDGGSPLFGRGVELAAELKGINPKLPIIGLSHYFDQRTGKAMTEDFVAFIQKRDLFVGQGLTQSKFLELIRGCFRKRVHSRKVKIFIVHGHDERTKYELKNYIQNTLRLGEPIILHEQASYGRSIIEKFEELAETVDLVFVILTPDDKAYRTEASDNSKARARQNVIFEMGYFFAKLQRTSGRVILLHKGDIEIPSDISGIIYIDISHGIEAAGEEIRREINKWLSKRKGGID